MSIPTSLSEIAGPTLRLRLIEPRDAPYAHRLRTDPAYNAHLSTVSGTTADQRLWIEAYKKREETGRELYYVIERKDGVSCGLVRLYDIGADRFTWGSWILDAGKPPKAALESALLSFGAGFDLLNLPLAHVDVRHGNERAESFYRRLGMIEERRDDANVYFVYPRTRYRSDRERLLAIIDGAAAR